MYPPGPKSLKHEQGRRFMEIARKKSFLSKLGVKSVEILETERLSVELDSGFDATIHPTGLFHFDGEEVGVNNLTILEKLIREISDAVDKCAKRHLKFALVFNSHYDLKLKEQRDAGLRIVAAIRSQSIFSKIQEIAEPEYLVVRLKRVSGTDTSMAGYGPGFVNLYLRLKPLLVKDMKNKYLSLPVNNVLRVALSELK